MRSGFAELSNATNEWYTPSWVFERLGLSFDLDPSSPGKDVVYWSPAETHYTLADDGLSKDWFGRVWMNPPYGKHVPVWLDKFIKHGNGIALLFARTDTKWFQDIATKSDAICFTRGRVAFMDKTASHSGSPACGSIFLAMGLECVAALERAKFGWIVRP